MFNLEIQKILLVLFAVISCSIAYSQESVKVELICPEHVTINCEEELEDLSSYGLAKYSIDEEVNDMENQQSKKRIDDCGKGHIERIWRYKSEQGEEFKCSQFIFVGEDKNGRALIKWPTKEVVLSWCDPSYMPNDMPYGAGRPIYFKGECNNMEETYSDEIVRISDSCKEVHRHWVVHDWCYDSNNVKGNDGHYKYTQIIKFEIPDDIDYLLLKDIVVTAEDCEKATVSIPDFKVAVQDCSRRIKVTNDSQFAESNKANASGVYPVGQTAVNYRVELECAEAREFTQLIVVNDPCKVEAIIDQKELEEKMLKSFVRPNPFTSSTEIILTNDISQDGKLTLYKTNGDIISEQEIKIEEGTHKIQIGETKLALPGVYYYAILVGDRKLEGRLIKIR